MPDAVLDEVALVNQIVRRERVGIHVAMIVTGNASVVICRDGVIQRDLVKTIARLLVGVCPDSFLFVVWHGLIEIGGTEPERVENVSMDT